MTAPKAASSQASEQDAKRFALAIELAQFNPNTVKCSACPWHGVPTYISGVPQTKCPACKANALIFDSGDLTATEVMEVKFLVLDEMI